MTGQLVEVAPIIKRVARRHKVRSWELRTGPGHEQARRELMVELRDAGLTIRAIADLLDCWPRTVHRTVGNGDRPAARPGSVCTACHQLLPVDMFAMARKKADGLQPYCRSCRRQIDYDARAVKIRYRRRAGDRERELVQVRVAAEIGDVLRATARRHRTSLASVVERSLAKTLACTNCHRALRSEHDDLCDACAKVWGVSA